jgi:hypothetical protein
VNKPVTKKEVERIRTCIARNRPYGKEAWQSEQADRLGLSHKMRSEGRPKAIKSRLLSQNERRPRCDSRLDFP